jgi:hypothetical protein
LGETEKSDADDARECSPRVAQVRCRARYARKPQASRVLNRAVQTFRHC